MLSVQRTGADGATQNPNIESLTCSVTVNSEIGPKSCACCQSTTAMGEKIPQPATGCDKVSNSHTSTTRVTLADSSPTV